MTPGEALLTVQKAMRDHGLPGGVGLRERDLTFIVCLAPRDRRAAPAVAELLTAMGCETTTAVNGHGTVYGHLAGGLLPSPELPPVPVSSSDGATVAESAVTEPVKRCADCLRWFPAGTFTWWNKPRGKRSPYCSGCNAARVKRIREARATRSA